MIPLASKEFTTTLDVTIARNRGGAGIVADGYWVIPPITIIDITSGLLSASS